MNPTPQSPSPVPPHEITIIGFPKCGTTALLDEYSRDSDFQLLYYSNTNKVEMIWPKIQNIKTQLIQNKILTHKYAHCIYNPEALAYLTRRNSEGIFVVLVRNPLKSLISWHNMHQRIASSKTYRNHKAYREKDFYSICSLDEYYYRHADLFQYDIHITNALSVIPKEKLVVVSQETMARGIDVVAQTIKHFARGDTPSTILEDLCASQTQTHTSYADKAKVDLSKSFIQELNGIALRTDKVLSQTIMHKII